jgi:hypothetical protein
LRRAFGLENSGLPSCHSYQAAWKERADRLPVSIALPFFEALRDFRQFPGTRYAFKQVRENK